MRIWIDADGAPAGMRDIVFRASQRLAIPVTLVANRPQQTPRSKLIGTVVVGHGLDVADDYIVEHVEPADLVITGDIPLAAQVVEKGATVLQHRGDVLDATNVRERLAVRDFREEVRNTGVMLGGPPPYDAKARQAFANRLDRLLTAWKRSQPA